MKVKQTSLIKFLPKLRSRKKSVLSSNKAKVKAQKEYTLKMGCDLVLRIQETHCLACGSRLFKNGHNNRLVIRDKWCGESKFRVQRKRCPKCGEIKPDYSQYGPKFKKHHDNFAQRARQHYMNGLMPSQIKDAFKIDFGVEISKTTIVNWINEVALPLRAVLKETPVPFSGYWNYDEIHMLIGGEKLYTLDTIDCVTRFVPATVISESMGRDAGRRLFQEARRNKQLSMAGLVKDCTTNLGDLMKTRSYKHLKQQNCLTHVKWATCKHVKAFAGLAKQSKKPVPPEWQWLLKRFYAVIDAKYETAAYVTLEILRDMIVRCEGKKIKELLTALKQIEGWLPKIIAHQRDSNLASTNNLIEGQYKKYKYYPSFKRNMMTPEGAQRVLDNRVYKHNFEGFPAYIESVESKYKEYRADLTKFPRDPSLKGQGRHFTSKLSKLKRWFGSYNQLWTQYFQIS